MLKKARFAHIATLVWWALIWTASSTPTPKMTSLRIVNWDKLAHAGVYFILGLLIGRSLSFLNIKRPWVQVIWLGAFLSAGLDELHQVFIPGRSVSVWDFLANGLGLGLAFLYCQRQHDRSNKTIS